jgi:hypothetical protein
MRGGRSRFGRIVCAPSIAMACDRWTDHDTHGLGYGSRRFPPVYVAVKLVRIDTPARGILKTKVVS